jgi:hypothetical protein
VNTVENQSTIDKPTSPWRAGWVAIGSGIIFLAMFIFLLSDDSTDFWMMNLPFVAFATAMSLIFLLPAYAIYLLIVTLVFRRKILSIRAGRRWFLGLPTLLLVGAILIWLNQARPSVAVSWITQGNPVKSIHSVHAAHVSTMMSDRQIAWFQIDPSELRSLIAQHQLVQTNGIDIRDFLTNDWVMRRSTIAERIPSFTVPIYYALFGSDEVQHPYRVIVLTNPNHDSAVWYSTYDR